jgi:hypothetical protein
MRTNQRGDDRTRDGPDLVRNADKKVGYNSSDDMALRPSSLKWPVPRACGGISTVALGFSKADHEKREKRVTTRFRSTLITTTISRMEYDRNGFVVEPDHHLELMGR